METIYPPLCCEKDMRLVVEIPTNITYVNTEEEASAKLNILEIYQCELCKRIVAE
jgi:hypothetical protein